MGKNVKKSGPQEGRVKARGATFVVPYAELPWEVTDHHLGATGRFDFFQGVQVYSFTERELLAFLEANRLFVDSSRPSGEKGVTWITLERAPEGLWPETRALVAKSAVPAPVLTLGRTFGFHKREESKAVFSYLARQILGRAVKREIELSVPHGEVAEYDTRGPFRVHVWSSSQAKAPHDGRVPDYIWGLNVLCKDESFRPNRTDGVLLKDDAYAVAELLPNALYIHHDAVHYGKDAEFRLFAEIMARAAKLLGSPEEYSRYLAEERTKALEREKNAFVDMVKRAAGARQARQNGSLEAAKKKAHRLAGEYFAAERDLFTLGQEQFDPREAERRFVAEFEKLKSGKVAMVEGATFDPKRPRFITIHTGEIVAAHPRRSAELRLIGHCDAEFNLETGDIRIVNRDRTVALYPDGSGVAHTPHVFDEDGNSVCLGNVGAELRAYIAHFEIEAAAVLTVAFLQSVTDQEGYVSRFERFPLYTKPAKAATKRRAT